MLRPIRVTILWSHWSGYMDACARALAERLNADVDVFHFTTDAIAPYETADFFRYARRSVEWDPLGDFAHEDEIVASAPDIVLVLSWHVPPYRRIATRLRGQALRLLCIDNQWHATLRQRLAVAASPVYLRPLYDIAFVPGARQAQFMRRVGFAAGQIVEGHMVGDFDAFAATLVSRRQQPVQRSFAFVGRLVPSKGIDLLAAAWASLHDGALRDWQLEIFGAGPLAAALAALPRVQIHDFVQPAALPQALLGSDVLVLPSRFEPWGVVIHEAAAAGMPVICSSACGAGDIFVRDGESGFVFEAGKLPALADAMMRIARQSDERLRAMGTCSHALAAGRTPRTWAQAICAAHERYWRDRPATTGPAPQCETRKMSRRGSLLH